MQGFWDDLFAEILKVSKWNLERIQDAQDGSIEAMSLLIEAAESFQYLQQAYHSKRPASIHVGVHFGD